MRLLSLLFALVAATAVAEPLAESPPSRPSMRQLPAAASLEAPPSARALVDARAEFDRRYPGLLARGRTTAGAALVADALIEAAVTEEDRGVKWFMLAEARRMAAASGNAATLDRAIVLASATYEFDAVEDEYRALKEIPLRILSPQRAAGLAEVAERVAARAAGDGRRDLAISAQSLAIRGWQRAGLIEPAKRAAIRHDEMLAP
ncbi:MAG: hypothetical protein K8S94_08275 [Planctomycetia bacterium]|nr:hypothetical protein [Planctomycetia bacterium]